MDGFFKVLLEPDFNKSARMLVNPLLILFPGMLLTITRRNELFMQLDVAKFLIFSLVVSLVIFAPYFLSRLFAVSMYLAYVVPRHPENKKLTAFHKEQGEFRLWPMALVVNSFVFWIIVINAVFKFVSVNSFTNFLLAIGWSLATIAPVVVLGELFVAGLGTRKSKFALCGLAGIIFLGGFTLLWFKIGLR